MERICVTDKLSLPTTIDCLNCNLIRFRALEIIVPWFSIELDEVGIQASQAIEPSPLPLHFVSDPMEERCGLATLVHQRPNAVLGIT